MPCLEEADLSELAQQHIEAQRSNIKNQRSRLTEIQGELQKLKSTPNPDPLKLAEVENAIADLEYHLNGRVRRSRIEAEVDQLASSGLSPDRLKRLRKALATERTNIVKDPDIDTAEDRAKVMEALYTQRQHLVFQDSAHDKDADGNSIRRYASVFGAPTVKKMREIGEIEIAEDLMLRSVSLVMSRNDSKNPNDYLDPIGLEVKASLTDGIEHHHIYNNVYIDKDGRVAPNSVRYFRNSKTGDIEMEVIPEYWNSAKHGKNTQFIELLDGAHSGDDPTTHLHYYKFNDADSATIRAKIQSKVAEINTQNAARSTRLEAELSELNQRKNDPVGYENKLKSQIADYDSQIAVNDGIEAKYTITNARGTKVKARNLTPDQENELQAAREQRKSAQKARDKSQKALTEHKSFMTLESDLQQWKADKISLETERNAIKLNVRFPDVNGYPDKQSAKLAKNALRDDMDKLQIKIRTSEQFLRDKGSLDQQIRDKTIKQEEAQKLASLTESEALAIYERSNGYFSFDKGSQESQDYSRSRPKMNSEIHKYNTRQAIEILESEHGDRAIDVLQEIADRSYQRNLLHSIEGMMNKVAGSFVL